MRFSEVPTPEPRGLLHLPKVESYLDGDGASRPRDAKLLEVPLLSEPEKHCRADLSELGKARDTH
jgi:hypothetical protein